MSDVLHITSGDIAGGNLAKAGLPGEVFVWHDLLYDGPRQPGWPGEAVLEARARFLEETTAGGLDREFILKTLHEQYQRLTAAASYERIVLWFDACLFDQSMLAHVLTCLSCKDIRQVELLCVDAFPGIERFNGLGQLRPEQLASLYSDRRPVTDEQFRFATVVDEAFAVQDAVLFAELSKLADPPLPWIPAAVTRWLQEQPDPASGLGRLEGLALTAIRAGCETPGRIFAAVAAADTPPQFWGIRCCGPRSTALRSVSLRWCGSRGPPTGCRNGEAQCHSRHSKSRHCRFSRCMQGGWCATPARRLQFEFPRQAAWRA